MFSWGLLLALAPDLIPLIVKAVLDVEVTVRGVLKGEIKKSRVMDIVRAVLQTKDYFLNGDDVQQAQLYAVIDEAVDFFVMSFNYLGLFKTSKKVDFSPKSGGEQ